MDRMFVTINAHIRKDKANTVEYSESKNGAISYKVLEINGISIFGVDIIKDKLIEELTKID